MRILIVEDEQRVRKSIVNDLVKSGFDHILEADDGEAALALINKEKPDIIVSDIRMPGMDGIQLLSRMKENKTDIPFIILSGYDLFEYAQKAVKFGAFSYLLKPVKIEELLQAINSAFNENSQKLLAQNNSQTPKIKLNQALCFKTEQELLSYFETCNKAACIKLVKDLYSNFYSSTTNAIEDLRNLNYQLIILFYKILNQLRLKPEVILGDEFILYTQANSLSSVDSIMKLYEEKIELCMQHIASAREKGNTRLMEKARDYINQNFSKEISLETVASHLRLSPEHFSREFKKETGENFIDYLTRLRISKAKEYLDKGSYKANEVSNMIGFYNEKYFLKLFKKYTGFTPTEYKNR